MARVQVFDFLKLERKVSREGRALLAVASTITIAFQVSRWLLDKGERTETPPKASEGSALLAVASSGGGCLL